MKTDKRIMEITPTESVIASFKHFDKGPTYAFSHSGVQFILREPPGSTDNFPSVNIDTARMSDIADLGKSVGATGTNDYQKLKSCQEDWALPGVQRDVHIVYPAEL
jgi:hypothetical protein